MGLRLTIGFMRSMRHEALWLGTIISGNDGISLFNISKALEAAKSEKFHALVASVLFSQGLKYIRYHHSFSPMTLRSCG